MINPFAYINDFFYSFVNPNLPPKPKNQIDRLFLTLLEETEFLGCYVLTEEAIRSPSVKHKEFCPILYAFSHKDEYGSETYYCIHGTHYLNLEGYIYTNDITSSRVYKKKIATFAGFLTYLPLYFEWDRIGDNLEETVSNSVQKYMFNWLNNHPNFFYRNTKNEKIHPFHRGLSIDEEIRFLKTGK